MILTASRPVVAHHVTAVLTVYVQAQRPDIQWMVRNLQTSALSEGERSNLVSYLEYLGLYRKESLSDSGKRARDTANVLMPEAGVYELYYVDDFSLGTKPICFERTRATDQLEDSTTQLEGFQSLEKGESILWSNGPEPGGVPFGIEFEHASDELPNAVIHEDIPGEASLLARDDGSVHWDIKIGTLRRTWDAPDTIDIGLNLKRLFRDWDSDSGSWLVAFDRDKIDEAARRTFKMGYDLGQQKLRFVNGEDPLPYKVSVGDVPLAPRTSRDAEEWLVHLVTTRVGAGAAFFAPSTIEEWQKEIVLTSPIGKRFPHLSMDVREVLHHIEGNLNQEKRPDSFDLYWRIRAAQDLSPPRWSAKNPSATKDS